MLVGEANELCLGRPGDGGDLGPVHGGPGRGAARGEAEDLLLVLLGDGLAELYLKSFCQNISQITLSLSTCSMDPELV